MIEQRRLSMPHVFVMDQNLFVGLRLKQALEAEGYRVTISQRVHALVELDEADLVMISHNQEPESGWETFHLLKQENASAALMIYVLDQWSLAGARWIIEAAGEAMKSRAKDRHSFFTGIPQSAPSALRDRRVAFSRG
jgi:CheY-like chemotaxis protein